MANGETSRHPWHLPALEEPRHLIFMDSTSSHLHHHAFSTLPFMFPQDYGFTFALLLVFKDHILQGRQQQEHALYDLQNGYANLSESVLHPSSSHQ